MKILLTGEPHSGKSTLINKILSHFDQKIGFVTNEILQNGQRVGFELMTSTGKKAKFASVDYDSNLRVSKYGIEPLILDDFIKALPMIDQQSLLYIDEVGQMQLSSSTFRKLVDEYISAPNNFIGTLSKIYDDELIQRLKRDDNIKIIKVTLKNRDLLEKEIYSTFTH